MDAMLQWEWENVVSNLSQNVNIFWKMEDKDKCTKKRDFMPNIYSHDSMTHEKLKKNILRLLI